MPKRKLFIPCDMFGLIPNDIILHANFPGTSDGKNYINVVEIIPNNNVNNLFWCNK